jgi:proliferating cell nuclear antigen
MSKVIAETENITNSMPELDTDDNKLLNKGKRLILKTVQSSAFRILIEALKEILTDTNLEFNEDGIKIIAMDVTHTVLVHLKLESKNFEHFFISKNLTIGINMSNFFKLIKTMGNNDTLTLYIDTDDVNRLGIKIENSEKNSITNYKLNLLDLSEENITIPPAEFNSVITMPSSDFQKLCRDMAVLADTLEIRSVDNLLIFSCNGDFATQETRLGQTNNGLTFIKNDTPHEIIQGFYALKHLTLFTKCTNLCNNIEMYIKNDYPLIVCYSVASLGHLKVAVCPYSVDE